MHVRLARFHNQSAEDLDYQASGIRENLQRLERGEGSGIPEELAAIVTRLVLLGDRESGDSVMLTFFETDEDLRTGDQLLNAMIPQGPGMGSRVSVEAFEVIVDVRPGHQDL